MTPYLTFEAKSGVEPSNCVELVKHIKLQCQNLKFSGLMTIGMPDYTSTPDNFRASIPSWSLESKYKCYIPFFEFFLVPYFTCLIIFFLLFMPSNGTDTYKLWS